MTPRNSLVLITILLSIVTLPLVVFLAGERPAGAETKALEPAASQEAKPVAQAAAKKETRFAIYLVKNPADEQAAEGMALKELALEEKPILTEEDIASYRISADGRHFIRLKPGVKVRVAPSAGETLLDRGFVVVADGNRVYLGDFNATISSHSPHVAWIRLPLSRPREAAELQIDIAIAPCPMMDSSGRPLCKDLRADPRILKALQDIGKLDTKPDPEGWGESYQGVKVRLTADKTRWRQGDEPSFKVEVLNVGNSDFHVATGPNACVLSVDGMWFESDAARLSDSLGPGGHFDSIVILKPEIWRLQGELLNLKPGKHKVRVQYLLLGSNYMDIRLFSNTVEIEILPADAKR
jgi:hypothetical protein